MYTKLFLSIWQTYELTNAYLGSCFCQFYTLNFISETKRDAEKYNRNILKNNCSFLKCNNISGVPAFKLKMLTFYMKRQHCNAEYNLVR